ncbi:hypothetical protein [uncultured Pontibacter sp.]|uniref:hypothetical protein n=1 Tax=uncultured Pontibacter sp. TaxID=453356 RepID=UPI00260611EC|nr:hypothetical protein [uncultured Pontibacter sp.]
MQKTSNYWLDLQRRNGIVPRGESFKASSTFDAKKVDTKNLSMMKLNKLLNLRIIKSRGCGGKRDEFSFGELSDEQQVHWVKSGIID